MDTTDLYIEEKVREIIQRAQPHSFCDYGCGEGVLLARLSKERVINGPLAGIDRFSRFPADKRPAIQTGLRFIDRENEDFSAFCKNEQFDLVLASHALHHFRTPIKELRSLWELTRPGGHVLIIDIDFAHDTKEQEARNLHSLVSEAYAAMTGRFHRHYYTLDEALDLVSALPFSIIESRSDRLNPPHEERVRITTEALEHVQKIKDKMVFPHPFLKDFFSSAYDFLGRSTPATGIDYSSLMYILLQRPVS